jgi:multicomponent Na+:H+ antiporter subunit F
VSVHVAVALAILATMALALIRALRGPTIYDRIVAVNAFGTKAVLLVALIAYATGNFDLIDVALVYALINFIAVVAVLKLVKVRDLAKAGDEGPADA